MKAASSGHFDYLQHLVQIGGDTSVRGNDGKTAIDYAKGWRSLSALNIQEKKIRE